MSGSAGLAAAKRRRAGPSMTTNELPRKPSNLPTPPPASVPQNLQQNTHPLALLIQHDQRISNLQEEINQLKSNNRQVITNVDEQSIQFYKTKYDSLSQEMEEVKKLLIKIQTFSLESNLKLIKMERALKNDPRMKEITIEEDNTNTIEIDRLSIHD
jgi:hypothetical protein